MGNMSKRTYWTKLNHDDARLAIDMMDDAEIGRWFRGWLAGASGNEYGPEKVAAWPVEMRTGFASGRDSFADAERYSEKQRDRVSKRYHGSTTVAPRNTTDATTYPTGSLPTNNQQPTTNNDHPEASNEQPAKSSKRSSSVIESIYQAYPVHIGKAAALKAITRALTRTTPEVLLEAVQAFAVAKAGSDPKFIPHPATWMNRGQWEDDRSTWSRESSPAARLQPWEIDRRRAELQTKRRDAVQDRNRFLPRSPEFAQKDQAVRTIDAELRQLEANT